MIIPFGFLKKTSGEINVLTNGDFTTDSDWTKGTGWTITGGQAVGTSASGLLSQNVGTGVGQIESGETYKVILDVIEVSAGGVEVRVGGTNGTTNFNSVGDDQEETGIVAGSDGFFRIDDSTPAFTGKLDNIRLIKTS